MTKAPADLTNPEMTTIMTETGADHTKTDTNMTYLKNKNTDEAICKKLRNRYEYDTDIHKTWSIPRGHILLHGLSLEWTTKLCIDFLNNLFYFIFIFK